jgi:hypothetical protein
VHPIAIEGEYLLVLQDSLFKLLLRSQHLGSGIMHKRRARERRQCSIGKHFRTCQIGSGRVGHLIEHARFQLPSQ